MINSALNRLPHDAAVTPRRGTRSIEAFQGFTSTDPLKRRIAHSGLIACLSTISALDRIEAHLPGFSRRALSFADYDSVVHCAIQSPILAYWAGRDAAIAACAETLIEAANRELSHRLTCLVDGINDAKAKLLETNDRTEFFTTIVMEVPKFLDFVARLIGLIHGCDQADRMVNSTTLLETLQPLELKPWISVFGQDLRSIWELQELTTLYLYAMNIHVERFLLSFGVILWRDETTGHPNIGCLRS